jgi:VanZ family protein
MAGNVGSGRNTYFLLQWLLSWFVVPTPHQLNMINAYMRKTGHALAYGFMYFLWFRAFRKQADYRPWPACFWSLGFCLLFASMDEGCQWFYESRGASIRDVILDMSGASLAALITAAVWRPGDLAAPIPLVSWWRKPYVLSYWLPPVLWSLAMLAVPRGLVPVEITLGPLKWLVSGFAWVNPHDLQILNLYLWETGQVLTFGILYVLWFRAFQGYAGVSRIRSCLYASGLCLYVPLLQEGLRTITLSRGINMQDVILGLTGVSLAALVTAGVWRPRRLALTLAGIPGRQTREPE